MTTSGKAINQVAADDAFECVSDGDAERGGESAGGGEVDEESSGKNGGPCAVAEDQKGGEGDASAGPDGSGAGGDVRQCQASATPVWPCTGRALAAVLLLGYRA